MAVDTMTVSEGDTVGATEEGGEEEGEKETGGNEEQGRGEIGTEEQRLAERLKKKRGLNQKDG